MPNRAIKTEDVYDFSQLPNPLEVGEQPLTNGMDRFDEHFHPEVGKLIYRNISFPHMHIMELGWETQKSIQLINELPNNNINLIFQLSGENHITYSGLNHNLKAETGLAYMVYNPDGTNISEVEASSKLEVLTISLDKDFFAGSIGHADGWSELVQKNLEDKKTFSGSNIALPFNPRMAQLIHTIQSYKKESPLSNMLVQSHAMELVGLHLEQLQTPVPHKEISLSDTDKLIRLKDYLDQHFLKEMTLTELSREFLLNDFKIKKGFKILYNTSVFNYLRNLRMDYAIDLLRDKRLNIDEIANLLGYEHPQHFSVAFKKHTGFTPSSMR